MNVSEILNKAADLIEPPGAHLRYDIAHDKSGRSVAPDSKDAVCWCAVGAIFAVSRFSAPKVRDLVEENIGDSLVSFNNRRTQAEVVAALRAAAEKSAS